MTVPCFPAVWLGSNVKQENEYSRIYEVAHSKALPEKIISLYLFLSSKAIATDSNEQKMKVD